MKNSGTDFLLSTFRELFTYMQPYLSDYQRFSNTLSQEVQVKSGGNIQYDFDIELDKIIKEELEAFGISGRHYSEESGFFEFGKEKYRVVIDPFCNSSLASKTFREAAAGISVFDYDFAFMSSGILDYQTGIVALAQENSTRFYQIQSGDEIFFNLDGKTRLEDSWVVATLENREERESRGRITGIMDKADRIIISSGHIYWLKLAVGAIDAYLDPFGGEALYEMFACTVAQGNGCIVTDLAGEEFDASLYLEKFTQDENLLFYPVAATNRELHEKVLQNID